MQFASLHSVLLRSALILSYNTSVLELNFVLIKNSSDEVAAYYEV